MTNLQTVAELTEIKAISHEKPCIIFKHSTRCNISSIAKTRLERDWNFGGDQIPAFYIDVLQSRPISNQVASDFAVHHESPQILLIWKGECVFEETHLNIDFEEIKEQIQQLN